MHLGQQPTTEQLLYSGPMVRQPGAPADEPGGMIEPAPVPWFMWALLIGALVMIPTTFMRGR